MKKPRITASLLLLALLTGCSEPEDEVDIPSYGDTTEPSGETSVLTDGKLRPENFDTDTYEGLRNKIIDYFHLILIDLDNLEKKGMKTEVFDPLREILIPMTEGLERVTTDELSTVEYPSRKIIQDYSTMMNIERLFSEYPDKIAENPEFVEYAKLIMKHNQLNFAGRLSVQYEAIYNAVFPDVSEPVLTQNADGTNTVTMPGFDGELVIYYGETDLPRYDSEDDKYALMSQPATLREHYRGTVTVMPVGEYQIVGRPYYLSAK